MKIIIVKDYKELSRKAADIIVSSLALKKDMVIGFATGSTPLGLYKELILAYKKEKADFSRVITFNLDEYYPIDKNNKNSYHYFMHKNLFQHISIKKEHTNFLDGLAKEPIAECKRYEKLIKKHKIDLQILGIGSNGHIGFNEPNTPFNSLTHKTRLSKKTIEDNSRFFSSIKDVPRFALTMGLKTIFDSKRIILLASGKQKAVAIKALVEGNITPSCPASILRHHADCTLILDKDAASLLEISPPKYL